MKVNPTKKWQSNLSAAIKAQIQGRENADTCVIRVESAMESVVTYGGKIITALKLATGGYDILVDNGVGTTQHHCESKSAMLRTVLQHI